MMNNPYPTAVSLSVSQGEEPLSRTNSLPSGMNTIEAPVQLRLSTARGNKRAQFWRNSVAITNSDYYNQWRPQMSPLVKLHGSGAITGPSAPSLDTISEYEMRGLGGAESQDQFRSPIIHAQMSRDRGAVADPNMFRYTSTPILDPARQTVPTPLSRPTTPQVGSGGFASSQMPFTPAISTTNFMKESSQAIHVSAAANNQFLPIFLNPETGNVYMFEDGYYIPVPSKDVQELEKATNITTLTKVPTPDRRTAAPLPKPPGNHRILVIIVMVLSCLCLNFPVFVMCLLPSLACSFQTRKSNSLGSTDDARRYSEWTLCSSITGLVFLVLTFIAIPITIVILIYAVEVIPV